MSNALLGWLLVAVAVLWTGNCLLYISRIGKERKPIMAGPAAIDTLINAGMVAVIVIGALRLGI